MLDVTLAGQPVAGGGAGGEPGGVGELRDPIRALAETLGRVRAYGAGQATKYRARLLACCAADADARRRRRGRPPSGPAEHRGAGPRRSTLARRRRGHVGAGLAPAARDPARRRRRCSRLLAGQRRGAVGRVAEADGGAGGDRGRPRHGRRHARRHDGAATADLFGRPVRGPRLPGLEPGHRRRQRRAGPGGDVGGGGRERAWVDAILLDIGLHYGTSGTSSNEVRDERLANSAAAALGSRAGSDAIGALGRMKADDRQPERVEADREGARGRGRASRDQPASSCSSSRSRTASTSGRLEIEVGDHAAVVGDRRRRRPARPGARRDGRRPRRCRRRSPTRRPPGARQRPGEGAAQGRAGARAHRGPVHRGPGVAGRAGVPRYSSTR